MKVFTEGDSALSLGFHPASDGKRSLDLTLVHEDFIVIGVDEKKISGKKFDYLGRQKNGKFIVVTAEVFGKKWHFTGFVREIEAGHVYVLPNFDQPQEDGQVLYFINKKKGEGDKLDLVHDGTTNEAVIEMLIVRLKYLDKKFPCEENKQAIKNLVAARDILLKRTKVRKDQGVEGKHMAHKPVDKKEVKKPVKKKR